MGKVQCKPLIPALIHSIFDHLCPALCLGGVGVAGLVKVLKIAAAFAAVDSEVLATILDPFHLFLMI